MALLYEDDHNHEDKKESIGPQGRHLLEPEKAHSTREFVIVAKFGAHV